MMKQFALCLLMLLAVATGFAQQTDSTQPALSDPNAWSVIVLPDPQNYVKYKRNHPLLDIMMNWIDENRERLHIKMVLCTGDLVEHNDITNPDGKKMDQTGLQQWETIAAAFGKIDGRIPYIAAAGNHDYNIFSYTHAPKHTNYPQFFTPEKNTLNKKMLREYTNNPDNTPSLENSCLEFTSPQGKPFLFMTVEFAPRDTILQWAKKVVTQPKYKNHTVVLLTHAYLNYKNEQMKTAKYDLEDANYGAAIWEKLVKPAGNIQLVVSGHIGEKDNARKHVGFRTDKNDAGRNVQQMTFNAQAMGGGHYGNGGDGWLRIMEFMPDGKTVHVKTFSPFFAMSPGTKHLARRRESFDEFSFELN
ncbi:metallophosphoesterase [Niastella populi]|uniref:Serine/threonine protein phosphatase n=1 Tax=Niastella populi TaxID=550983 RepID=A0A1V9FJ29_9BACT|nr:metallophosphoesterase [Niastella populi]OQP58374.1 serine/threonine protein phosphatase [Niastella populi]